MIVLWTDLLPTVRPEEARDDRRTLYMAITRAESGLVLLGQPGTGFAADLEAQCAVRDYPFEGVAEPVLT